MKLFTNGCSFTWGGAIYPSLYDDQGNLLDHQNSSPINQQRLSQVWPAHLAGLCKAEKYANLSIGCGSNQRILRTTFDYFSNLMYRSEWSNDWTAVIQWSIPYRFEHWDEKTNSWTMCIPNGSMTSKKTDHKEHLRIDEFAKHIWINFNDKTYSQQYYSQVVGLSSFFEKHNIPYWFSNLDTTVLDYLEDHQRQYLQNQVSWIGDNVYKSFGSLFEQRHHSDSGHPSLLGHQQIAHSIYNLIKDELV